MGTATINSGEVYTLVCTVDLVNHTGEYGVIAGEGAYAKAFPRNLTKATSKNVSYYTTAKTLKIKGE